eukprot:12385252-Karenia_brevis.AAC.1
MLRKILGASRQRSQRAADVATNSTSTQSDTESGDLQTTASESEWQETWAEFMKRATHIAEGHARRAKVTDWLVGQRWRKFCLAGHMARRSDGRWTTKFLSWEPVGGSRTRGHPKMRWTDAITNFCKRAASSDNWIALAQDRDVWNNLATIFAGE